MEFLKKTKLVFLLPLLIINLSCVSEDGTVTLIYPIETDTYISSVDPSDHSNYGYLSIFKSGTNENRALVKLPTGQQDYNSNIDDCLNNPYCFVFFMPLVILKALLSPNCLDSTYTAANLNWAYLQFDTVDGSSPAAGSLNINLLAQPWWHEVNWTTTHPFTSNGVWATPGGTIDSGVAFNANCVGLSGGQTCTGGEVKFEMTAYMGALLSNTNSTHYGMVISTPVDAPEVRLRSVQSTAGFGPRLVANYTCITPASTHSKTQTHTYYLGTPIPMD